MPANVEPDNAETPQTLRPSAVAVALRSERVPVQVPVVVPDLLRYATAVALDRRHRVPHHAGAGAPGPVGARHRAAAPLRPGTSPRSPRVLARRCHSRRLAVHPHVGHRAGCRRARRDPQRPRPRGRDRLSADRPDPRRHRPVADRHRTGAAPAPPPTVAVGRRRRGNLGLGQHLRLPGQQRRRRDAAAHERRVHRRPAAHRGCGARHGGPSGARSA